MTELAEAPVDELPAPVHRVLNRELSWLDFNDRVLQLAAEPGIPLIERAKFCAIVSTNRSTVVAGDSPCRSQVVRPPPNRAISSSSQRWGAEPTPKANRRADPTRSRIVPSTDRS